MKSILYSFIACLIFSCSEKSKKTTIIIEGNITGLPDTKLYLVEAKKWKTPVDSADCVNGHFVFHVKIDSSFYPWLAAIHFIKDGDTEHPQRLKFRNHQLGEDSLQYLRDAFYIERSGVSLSGTYDSTPWIRIMSGRENELYFKNQFSDIGWMGDKDNAQRKQKMDTLAAAIKQQPWSFFLLQSIYDSKEQYSKEEMMTLTGLFDDTIRSSAPFNQFSHYLAMRPGRDEPYPAIFLPAPDNTYLAVVDSAADVTMIIFWASWCMPCRNEIPQLKTLYKKYQGKPVRLVSVSIDTEPGLWQKALQQEQLPWQQFIIPKEKIEEIENIFSFTTIPFVVFTTRDGKELGRIADYDPDNTARYDSILKKFSQQANR